MLHRCDAPLCVHADLDPAVSHLRTGLGWTTPTIAPAGTAPAWTLGFHGLARKGCAHRFRVLRDAIRVYGWDDSTIHTIFAGGCSALTDDEWASVCGR